MTTMIDVESAAYKKMMMRLMSRTFWTGVGLGIIGSSITWSAILIIAKVRV